MHIFLRDYIQTGSNSVLFTNYELYAYLTHTLNLEIVEKIRTVVSKILSKNCDFSTQHGFQTM